MTAKQIMKFAEDHAYDENMLNDLELELNEEKYEILVKLEHEPDSRKFNREYQDVLEKLRMIHILRLQRLEFL